MGRTIIIGICDGEEIWREHMFTYCTTYFKELMFKVEYRFFHTGEQVLECQDELNILFLGQQMGKINSIEVKEALEQSFSKIMIVFYANREEIAEIILKAFGWNVIGILCKPLNVLEFSELMDRILRKITGMSYIQSFDTNRGKIQIPCREILVITAEDCYSRITMQDGKELLIRKTLSVIERENEYPYLVRIHRSYIVNFGADCKIVRNGDLIRLPNNSTLPIAKRRKKEVQKMYVKIQENKTDIICK